MPLDELNTSSPAGADDANTIDDQIRALKEDIKESFHGNESGTGSAAPEHFGKGAHRFPTGDGTATGLPDVPAAGHAGRIFLDTINGGILRDDGSVWKFLQSRVAFDSNAALALSLTASYQTLVDVSLNVPSGGRILCLATAEVIMGNPGAYVFRVFNGVNPLLPDEMELVIDATE